jgi:hypothetical protein
VPIPCPYGAQGLSFIPPWPRCAELPPHTLVLVAPPGADLLEVTVTDVVECLLGICSAYALAEKTVRKRRHRRWLLLLLSQRGHGRFVRPEKCSAVRG